MVDSVETDVEDDDVDIVASINLMYQILNQISDFSQLFASILESIEQLKP